MNHSFNRLTTVAALDIGSSKVCCIIAKISRDKRINVVGYGYNALTDEYCDVMKAGIIDPTKVTRSALQNAASVAATLLTTESLVADIPEPPAPQMPANPDMY